MARRKRARRDRESKIKREFPITSQINARLIAPVPQKAGSGLFCGRAIPLRERRETPVEVLVKLAMDPMALPGSGQGAFVPGEIVGDFFCPGFLTVPQTTTIKEEE